MSKQKRIFITGASGFIGSALFRLLSENTAYEVTGTCREKNPDDNKLVALGDLDGESDWSNILIEQDVVIHAAARTHVMGGNDAVLLEEYRSTNVVGTLNLARQAAQAGVRRFIFISSVKVNGESTSNRKPYSEKDLPSPEDAYGISKMEAEQGLQNIANQTGMEVVIIRPPLVYGQGVRANFSKLLMLAQTRYPLPFRLVDNKRSMIYIDNLTDFVAHCIEHPKAANHIFLVADGEDISLSYLLTLMRASMGRFVWLVPIPISMFRMLGVILRKNDVVERLVGNLQIDSSKARQLLGWNPPFNVEQGINQTVKVFMEGR